MRLVIALLALVMLAGCANKFDLSGSDWKKPSTMYQDVTYDEMECVRAAREAGWTPDVYIGGIADVVRFTIEERQRDGAFHRCMIAKGYQPSGS